jgi:hypothetical protein
MTEDVVLLWPLLFEGQLKTDANYLRNGDGYGRGKGKGNGYGYGRGKGSGRGKGRIVRRISLEPSC